MDVLAGALALALALATLRLLGRLQAGSGFSGSGGDGGRGHLSSGGGSGVVAQGRLLGARCRSRRRALELRQLLGAGPMRCR